MIMETMIDRIGEKEGRSELVNNDARLRQPPIFLIQVVLHDYFAHSNTYPGIGASAILHILFSAL